MAESPEPTVIHFDPPEPVFLLDLEGATILETLRLPTDIHEGIGISIRSPWNKDRFLPGIARGKGVEYLMDVGESFGSLLFDEEEGWGCRALVPKQQVMSGLAKRLVDEQKAKSRSFTERLVKKAAKRK